MPNANSVISSWINSYDSAFYTALTNQEDSAYNQGSGVANWQGLFTTLNGLMTTYKLASRYSTLVDFMPILYAYRTFNLMYGTDGSLLTSADALTLYSMNGFTTACKGRATSYYNDISVGSGTGATATATISGGAVTGYNMTANGVNYGVDAGTYVAIHGGGGEGAYGSPNVAGDTSISSITPIYGGTGYTSPPTVVISSVNSTRLQTDGATVTNAISPEESTIVALKAPMLAAYKPQTGKLLFDSPTILATADKVTMKNYIFLTLHYKSVYQQLNISPLVLPPGV